MKKIKLIFVFTLLLAVTGCAIGNSYDYRQADASLPLAGSGELGAGVVEMRSYVLDGDKAPNFIGLQRGGFGNPFDVETTSGKAMTDDMTNVLSRALNSAGYTVNQLYFSSPDSAVIADIVAKEGKDKNVILMVKEWKTDAMWNFSLIYDLDLQVIDRQGNVLASNTLKGDEKLSGAGFESQNSNSAVAALETKIGRLFNSPEIIAALQN
jgi:hypothetical protein